MNGTIIHPTAIVAKEAQIGSEVEIGPYCVIGPYVKIGDRVKIHSHVVIDGHTTIGKDCEIFPFAAIGTRTQDMKYKGDITYVEIGERTIIREYVTVNSGTFEHEVTRVGASCVLMAYSHVAHGCELGNEVIIANAVALAGHVKIEDRAIIGGLTGVHQFVRIGSLCMIGGCSRIVQDCPPYMLVVGNPAEVKGINSVGLQRRGIPPDVRSALKECYKILYKRSLNITSALSEMEKQFGNITEVKRLIEFVKNSERGITV